MSIHSVIPAPLQVTPLSSSVPVGALRSLTVSDVRFLPVAARFREDLRLWAGVSLPAPEVTSVPPTGGIHVTRPHGNGVRSRTLSSKEAYGLSVTSEGVIVEAHDSEGLYRGLTSLIQLVGTAEGDLSQLKIVDKPALRWRGLSLDVARSFVSVEDIKRTIDVIALYKFNTLHLHLTDNEAWRLEIESWPLLTPPPSHGEARQYYTKSEFSDIVSYAAERFVSVVPEIDMPGHSAAAIRAYPQLSSQGVAAADEQFPVANMDGAPGFVSKFVRDVLSELAAMTPGQYLHIGGDEAFGMTPDDQADFVRSVVSVVKDLGKSAIGWQETCRAQLGPAQVVQYWIDFADELAARSNEPRAYASTSASEDASETAPGLAGETAALLAESFLRAVGDKERINEQSTDVILSPTRNAYLDRPYAESSISIGQKNLGDRLGLPFYPPTHLQDYLEWNPVAAAQPINRERILGIEAALWGETIHSPEDLEALLLPRLPGLAEVGWAEPGTAKWEHHRARLSMHARLWNRFGWNWFQVDSIDWRV
ncbi:family 20 glycosylhydrolase [Paenarthrobacter sp. AB444]|uniref:family 20 glycosylhydrolase n=1 Tax=Paenarthrobacter sp. AB444 TaxID=3025681 RepID=UPI002365A92F|nr:family 20 glycosylhydrolase [Paenarthrobacter sp. AB444]MDD7833894.1 family 20 glycosylhydrolase [Paenarthrobacter sp. AB444]